MTRNEHWLTFIRALQSLTALPRPLRVCFDGYFADKTDFGMLPTLFPFVEKIGIIVPDSQASSIYQHKFNSSGWEKVVPIVEGHQFSDYWDIVVNRW